MINSYIYNYTIKIINSVSEFYEEIHLLNLNLPCKLCQVPKLVDIQHTDGRTARQVKDEEPQPTLARYQYQGRLIFNI